MDEDSPSSIALQIALQRFKEEIDRHQALDTKASLILGFSGVLAGLLLNSIKDVLTKPTPGIIVLCISTPLLFGILAILSSAFLSLATLWIRDYTGGPGGAILARLAKTTKTKLELETILVEAYTGAFENNRVENDRKAQYLTASFITITGGTALVFFALVLFTIALEVYR